MVRKYGFNVKYGCYISVCVCLIFMFNIQLSSNFFPPHISDVLLIMGGGGTGPKVEILPPSGVTCTGTIPNLPGSIPDLARMISLNGVLITCGSNIDKTCYQFNSVTRVWDQSITLTNVGFGDTRMIKLNSNEFLVTGNVAWV